MLGKILNNRYEIIEKIGEGGMAKVYKAKCNVLNRFVAIKVLRDEYIEDDTFPNDFKRESQAAASLSHPNILNIYDVGNVKMENGNMPYIVMEYINGKTLKKVITEKGKLSSNETISYTLQIAEAIEHAHSNSIIHRDIKPHNIMINENDRVKVTDFGIAKAVTSSTVTIGSDTLGSVHYISPEQARGGYTDEKSDIYSLGIVMYEMITGKLPFNADTPVAVALKHVQEEIVPPSEIEPNISKKLEAIILKCTSKNQSDRYQSMAELIADLKNIDILVVPIASSNKDMEDSPTMIIPPVGDDNIKKKDNYTEPKKKKNKKASGAKTTVFAILLALLVVGTMFFAYFKFKDGFNTTEVIVPDFVGSDIEEAELEAEKLKLKLVIEDRVQNDEFEEGEIVKQDQEANSKVKSGFTIGVIISEGGELIKVPNFKNQTLDEAMKLLDELGFELGDTKYEFSDIVPQETIIEQRPNANTFLSKGDKVIFTISKGEEIKPVIMPSLVGQNVIDATNKLLSMGLKVGNVKEDYNNDFPKDVVFFQSSNKGTELKTGTNIDLYVSKGTEPKPEPEPEPEPKPEPEPEPEPELEPEQDPVEGKIRIIIPLPDISTGDQYDSMRVSVKRTQDGKEMEIYNKDHLTDGKEIDITSRGKKGAKFSIYFDGELHETKIKQE